MAQTPKIARQRDRFQYDTIKWLAGERKLMPLGYQYNLGMSETWNLRAEAVTLANTLRATTSMPDTDDQPATPARLRRVEQAYLSRGLAL